MIKVKLLRLAEAAGLAAMAAGAALVVHAQDFAVMPLSAVFAELAATVLR